MKVAVTGSIVLIACIFSCGEEYQERTNSAPRIIVESVIPPDAGQFTLDLEPVCAPITFKAGQVEDKDIMDILYVAWFMNWQPGQSDPNVSWICILPSEEEIREGPELSLSTSEFNPDEIYSLRVVIADRPAQMCSEGIEFPDHDDGQYDLYEWTFVTKLGEGYCVP